MTVRSFAAVCLLALGVLVVVIARGGDVPLPADAGAAPGQRAGGHPGTAADPGGAGPAVRLYGPHGQAGPAGGHPVGGEPVSAHLIARMEVITGLGMEPDHLMGEGEREL